MADTPIRWGILGPGSIAHQFAEGLKSAPGARLTAVGSRDQAKADTFGAKYDIPGRHASYEALASDPNVDIIYIATPHPMHADNAILCLEHGKAVLSEKPFTVSRRQAEPVVAKAREKGLFLMEGMWSRFFPLMGELKQRLADGAIGDPRLLQSDFGFRAGVNPESRLFNLNLGGGALLDVGVYVVSLASYLFGTPSAVAGVADIGTTGVDEQAGMTLLYPGGQIALLSTAIRTNTPQEATISGTDGTLRITSPWWKAAHATIEANGKTETLTHPFENNGFQFEAIHAMECLRAGKTESDVLPLDETLAILGTMDTLRAQWGIKYPMD